MTILAKNFIVFAASSIAFLVLGWGLMFGDGNPFVGTRGIVVCRWRGQQSSDGGCVQGRLFLDQLDRGSFVDEVFLPIGFCRNRGDDCLGRGGRAD